LHGASGVLCFPELWLFVLYVVRICILLVYCVYLCGIVLLLLNIRIICYADRMGKDYVDKYCAFTCVSFFLVGCVSYLVYTLYVMHNKGSVDNYYYFCINMFYWYFVLNSFVMCMGTLFIHMYGIFHIQCVRHKVCRLSGKRTRGQVLLSTGILYVFVYRRHIYVDKFRIFTNVFLYVLVC